MIAAGMVIPDEEVSELRRAIRADELHDAREAVIEAAKAFANPETGWYGSGGACKMIDIIHESVRALEQAEGKQG